MKKAISNGLVNFTFDGLAPVTFDPAKASEANRNYAVAFGFSHRIGDHAAISRNGPNGSVVTVTEEMRRNAVLEMVTHLESGTENWDMAKGTRGPVQHPVFLAIAVKLGISYDEAVAKVQGDNLAELTTE